MKSDDWLAEYWGDVSLLKIKEAQFSPTRTVRYSWHNKPTGIAHVIHHPHKWLQKCRTLYRRRTMFDQERRITMDTIRPQIINQIGLILWKEFWIWQLRAKE